MFNQIGGGFCGLCGADGKTSTSCPASPSIKPGKNGYSAATIIHAAKMRDADAIHRAREAGVLAAIGFEPGSAQARAILVANGYSPGAAEVASLSEAEPRAMQPEGMREPNIEHLSMMQGATTASSSASSSVPSALRGTPVLRSSATGTPVVPGAPVLKNRQSEGLAKYNEFKAQVRAERGFVNGRKANTAETAAIHEEASRRHEEWKIQNAIQKQGDVRVQRHPGRIVGTRNVLGPYVHLEGEHKTYCNSFNVLHEDIAERRAACLRRKNICKFTAQNVCQASLTDAPHAQFYDGFEAKQWTPERLSADPVVLARLRQPSSPPREASPVQQRQPSPPPPRKASPVPQRQPSPPPRKASPVQQRQQDDLAVLRLHKPKYAAPPPPRKASPVQQRQPSPPPRKASPVPIAPPRRKKQKAIDVPVQPQRRQVPELQHNLIDLPPVHPPQRRQALDVQQNLMDFTPFRPVARRQAPTMQDNLIEFTPARTPRQQKQVPEMQQNLMAFTPARTPRQQQKQVPEMQQNLMAFTPARTPRQQYQQTVEAAGSNHSTPVKSPRHQRQQRQQQAADSDQRKLQQLEEALRANMFDVSDSEADDEDDNVDSDDDDDN